MGNKVACKSGPCKEPKPVYKTVLSQIFQIAWEKPKADMNASRPANVDPTGTNPTEVDIPKLEAHVKSHIKALIDYLEGSHSKLIDTGAYLHKVVTGSYNPDVHMLGLFCIIELLTVSSKFSHDKTFLEKLHQRVPQEEFTKAEDKGSAKSTSKSGKDLDADSFMEQGALIDNIVMFEDYVIEILMFLIDVKRNPISRKICFKYVLQSLDLYAKNHFGTLSGERLEIILTEMFGLIGSFEGFKTYEDYEVQWLFLNVLIDFMRTNTVVFKFKHRFITHGCNTLKLTYDLKQDNEARNNQLSVEVNNIINKIVQTAFGLIGTVTQSVYDLNEFGILITPLFTFFDNIKWKNIELQNDVFVSLMESMSNTIFEQVEIFLIDKIIEYIDYDNSNKNITLNTYKNNSELGVKIRVFSLLTTIFRRTQKTFLSFLVTDNITHCFINNLKYAGSSSGAEGEELRSAIYNCQREFIEKINVSSKNLIQLLNSIAKEIQQLSLENKGGNQIIEAIHFLDFSIRNILLFPGQSLVPKECTNVLLKLRGKEELLYTSLSPAHRLLKLSHHNDEGSSPRFKGADPRKSEYLHCAPETAYAILGSNIEHTKILANKYQSDKLLKMVLHCAEVNEALIKRKDSTLIVFEVAFMRKIIELIYSINNSKSNIGILEFLVYHFCKLLRDNFAMDALTPFIEDYAHRVSPGAIQILESKKETAAEDAKRVLPIFESVEFGTPEQRKDQYEDILENIIHHIKTSNLVPHSDNLKEDFEALYNIYCGNALNLDEDSYKIEASVDQNRSVLTDGTPRPMPTSAKNGMKVNHKGSIQFFNQINFGGTQGNLTKNSLHTRNDENQVDRSGNSIMLDHSFEQALKEAKKNKPKMTNLNKILDN